MRIAFYAPLKSPDHKVPSGDRRVARLFLDALRLAGHDPFIASRLRGFDPAGDAARQARIAERGASIAAKLIAQWRKQPRSRPHLWLTYHLFYKAPDWIGPPVCRALGIPYVVAEASVAMKRAAGGWAAGHNAVVAALRQAQLVIGLNPADREGVLPFIHPDDWAALPPFLDAGRYAAASRPAGGVMRLVAVAMMRPGDKLSSYRVLGAALARLLDLDWTLDVVGDGPAAREVAAALAPLGSRVRYRGELSEGDVAALLAGSDLFVWPAINEAFGMALLEAQASGLAVVAGDGGGVSSVVAHGKTGLLVPPSDAVAFAAAVRRLIAHPARCAELGAAARCKVLRRHDLAPAARQLAAMLALSRPIRAA